MSVPKSIIHVNTSFAVQPTEEQLLEFFKEYGLETMDDIVVEYNGDWSEIIREWFVNTYYGVDYQQLCQSKNILRFESDYQEDNVELISKDQWDNYVDDGIIY